MKRISYILVLTILTLTSCIKESYDGCPQKWFLKYDYVHGGINRLDTATVKTEMITQFFDAQGVYREENNPIDSLEKYKPVVYEKEQLPQDSSILIAWTGGDKLTHVVTDKPSTSYVTLNETSDGSGLYIPASPDLLYGKLKYNNVVDEETSDTIHMQDVVCQFKIQMTNAPQNATYHFRGTPAAVDYNKETQGGNKTLEIPGNFYINDRGEQCLDTEWFGAFESSDPIFVDVVLDDGTVYTFDFTNNPDIRSKAGDKILIMLDYKGSYGSRVYFDITVEVNGWIMMEESNNMFIG